MKKQIKNILSVLISLLLITQTIGATAPSSVGTTSGINLGLNNSSIVLCSKIINDNPVSLSLLGTAQNFGVIGASTITNTGTSFVNGSLALFPGTSVVGFPPGTYSGTLHVSNATAAQAQADALIAYNNLVNMTNATDLTGLPLAGMNLTPGVYKFNSSASLVGGTLTLNAQNNSNAIWVFQIGTTLTTGTSTSVVMINGGQPNNVYWAVGSSATFGVGTSFIGNVVAQISVTATTIATFTGRLIALTGAVTMDTNTVTQPAVSSGMILWGMCDGRTPIGNFSYDVNGSTLKFNATGSGLGLGFNPYPEVSNLTVVGITSSSITWRWITPNKTYFVKNIVNVTKVSDNSVVAGYPMNISLSPNITYNHLVAGLLSNTSYRIVVQSVYTDLTPIDTNYSLIYFKDSNVSHQLPSTLSVVELARNMSVNGTVKFSGFYNIGTNIPAPDDVNYPLGKGRIWILPTLELNMTTMKPLLTGYCNGCTLVDYMFEEDTSLLPPLPGGIKYTYIP